MGNCAGGMSQHASELLSSLRMRSPELSVLCTRSSDDSRLKRHWNRAGRISLKGEGGMTDLACGTERKSSVSAPHDAKNKKNTITY